MVIQSVNKDFSIKNFLFNFYWLKMMWTRIAALTGALGICFGAFGGHGLKKMNIDHQLIENWKTGAQYHLIHTLALLFTSTHAHPYKNLICSLFFGGILFFSGSLYLMALTDQRKLGAITPIGGLMFIFAWVLLCL